MTSDQFNQNLRVLQLITKFAGILCVIQSIIWLGISSCGILVYFCTWDFSEIAFNLETITKLTIYKLYFDGNCTSNNFPGGEEFLNNISKIQQNTFLNSTYIFYGACTYVGLSFLWFFVSSVLVKQNCRDNRISERSNVLRYLWILITLLISLLDITSSTVFGMDYNEFRKIAMTINDFQNESLHKQTVNSAMQSAIFMMFISSRGIILWIINVFLLIYIFIKTLLIKCSTVDNHDEDANIEFVNGMRSVHDRRPIRAFENGSYNGRSPNIDTAALERAYQMSLQALQERHGNYRDGFTNQNFHRSNEHICPLHIPTAPVPDYTPPMSRANQTRQNSERQRF